MNACLILLLKDMILFFSNLLFAIALEQIVIVLAFQLQT